MGGGRGWGVGGGARGALQMGVGCLEGQKEAMQVERPHGRMPQHQRRPRSAARPTMLAAAQAARWHGQSLHRSAAQLFCVAPSAGLPRPASPCRALPHHFSKGLDRVVDGGLDVLLGDEQHEAQGAGEHEQTLDHPARAEVLAAGTARGEQKDECGVRGQGMKEPQEPTRLLQGRCWGPPPLCAAPHPHNCTRYVHKMYKRECCAHLRG